MKKKKKVVFFFVPFYQGLTSGFYYLSNINQATWFFYLLEEVRGQDNTWNFRFCDPPVSYIQTHEKKQTVMVSSHYVQDGLFCSSSWRRQEWGGRGYISGVGGMQGFQWDPGVWSSSWEAWDCPHWGRHCPYMWKRRTVPVGLDLAQSVSEEGTHYLMKGC